MGNGRVQFNYLKKNGATTTHEVRRCASLLPGMRIKLPGACVVAFACIVVKVGFASWRKQWNAPACNRGCTLPTADSVQQKIGSSAGIWDLRSRLCCLVQVGSAILDLTCDTSSLFWIRKGEGRAVCAYLIRDCARLCYCCCCIHCSVMIDIQYRCLPIIWCSLQNTGVRFWSGKWR